MTYTRSFVYPHVSERERVCVCDRRTHTHVSTQRSTFTYTHTHTHTCTHPYTEAYAMDRFAYYQCWQCHRAYFAGMRVCMYVYVCMCVYVFICVCMCVYVCVYMCVYICVCAEIYSSPQACDAGERVEEYDPKVCVCMYMCMCMRVYAYIYVCVCLCQTQELMCGACIGGALAEECPQHGKEFMVCVYIFVCVCYVCLAVHTHTHTYIYIYIHTHMHRRTNVDFAVRLRRGGAGEQHPSVTHVIVGNRRVCIHIYSIYVHIYMHT